MRGLPDKFLQDLLKGSLHGFLTAVQSDDTLCLEIRDDYVNIYYRGGNLCRIVPKSGSYSMKFDSNYAKTPKHKELIKNKKNWSISEWVANIPLLKLIIDTYEPPFEREIQQLILRENNKSPVSNGTDYFIIDIEYANSKNGSRFDMVAVRWPSTSSERRKKSNRRFAFIELKYGDKALSGNAGILEHIKDMKNYLGNSNILQNLGQEMAEVFNQKVELGLLPKKPGKIKSFSSGRPEFILLIANHDPDSTVLKRELREVCKSDEYEALCKLCDLKIAKASPLGYGLYERCMISIDEYIKQL